MWVDYPTGEQYSIGGDWPEPVPPPGCAGCRSVYYYVRGGRTYQATTANFHNGTAASCEAFPVGVPITKPDLRGARYSGSFLLRDERVDHWLHADHSESYWSQAGTTTGSQRMLRSVLPGGLGGFVDYFGGFVRDPESMPEVPVVCPQPTAAVPVA